MISRLSNFQSASTSECVFDFPWCGRLPGPFCADCELRKEDPSVAGEVSDQ